MMLFYPASADAQSYYPQFIKHHKVAMFIRNVLHSHGKNHLTWRCNITLRRTLHDDLYVIYGVNRQRKWTSQVSLFCVKLD